MLEMSNDYLIVREESIRIYFLCVIVLLYFEYYTFLWFYAFWALSLVMSEDDVDSLHEDDAFKHYEVYFTLRPFEEVDGLVLLDWEIDELLEMPMEDAIFPNHYKLIDAYKEDINSSNSKMRRGISELVQTNNVWNKQKILQSKLVLTQEFNQFYAGKSRLGRLRLVKFKTVALIVNTFIVETLVARGLYSSTQYDYDMFFAKGETFDTLFLEFLLVFDASSNTYLKGIINYNAQTEDMTNVVFEQLIPHDYQLHDYLEGKTEDIFQKWTG